MTLVADESVDAHIVAALRQAGYQVHYIAETQAGLTDEAVLRASRKRQAPLLTADKDFGELVFRQHQLMTGVVLLRLAGLNPLRKNQCVLAFVRNHLEQLHGGFAVVSPMAVRIRRAAP